MKYWTLLLMFVTDVALACSGMNAQEFEARLKKEPAKQLVFFASWCASCKKHLTPETAANSYFIAVFDEEAAATRAFEKFLGPDHLKKCIWDKDGSLVKAFEVKRLPLVKTIDIKS